MPSLAFTCQTTAANCPPASRDTGSPPPDTVDGHPGGEQPELRGQRPPPVDGSGSGVLQAQSDAARPVVEQLKVRRVRDEVEHPVAEHDQPSTMPVRRSRYAREAPAAVTVAQTVDISSPCDHGYEAGSEVRPGRSPIRSTPTATSPRHSKSDPLVANISAGNDARGTVGRAVKATPACPDMNTPPRSQPRAGADALDERGSPRPCPVALPGPQPSGHVRHDEPLGIGGQRIAATAQPPRDAGGGAARERLVQPGVERRRRRPARRSGKAGEPAPHAVTPGGRLLRRGGVSLLGGAAGVSNLHRSGAPRRRSEEVRRSPTTSRSSRARSVLASVTEGIPPRPPVAPPECRRTTPPRRSRACSRTGSRTPRRWA
jgi:hypothetical protein